MAHPLKFSLPSYSLDHLSHFHEHQSQWFYLQNQRRHNEKQTMNLCTNKVKNSIGFNKSLFESLHKLSQFYKKTQDNEAPSKSYFQSSMETQT